MSEDVIIDVLSAGLLLTSNFFAHRDQKCTPVFAHTSNGLPYATQKNHQRRRE